jgi:hypothetical protein
MADYFVRRGQTVKGPFRSEIVRQLALQAKLRKDDEVRLGDDGDWMAAGKIDGLFDPNAGDGELIRDPLANLASQAAGTVGKAALQIGGALKGILTKKPAPASGVLVSQKPVTLAPGWLQTLTAEKQDPATVAQVVERVEAILMDGEKIGYVAVQAKPIMNWFPDCVVLTNERFILYRPKLLGRVDFEDYRWLMLSDCTLEENILGSTLAFVTSGGERVALDYLPKDQARRLYRVAQEHEQKSYEERRQRRMEEDRARAGGVNVHTNVGVAAQPAAVPSGAQQQSGGDPVALLTQLKTMRDADLISAAEFEAKKAEILKRM